MMPYTKREFLKLSATLGGLLLSPTLFAKESYRDLSSSQVSEMFKQFALTHKKPKELEQWLTDPLVQKIPPYKVFDNVWYVGLRWVAAYLIKTSDGYILIDTLHDPFVDHLIDNLKTLNVRPEEIKYVIMTHGHFDHVGGAYALKPLLKNAQFAMGKIGWEEAIRTPNNPTAPAKMISVDRVLQDQEKIVLGDTTVVALSTPGHTMGTFSYLYPVYFDGQRHTAVTIGGLGLNAIKNKDQIKAYIQSMKRLSDPKLAIGVDLTAHPFSTGQTELIERIEQRKSGQPHPLVSRKAFVSHLQELSSGAQALLSQVK